MIWLLAIHHTSWLTAGTCGQVWDARGNAVTSGAEMHDISRGGWHQLQAAYASTEYKEKEDDRVGYTALFYRAWTLHVHSGRSLTRLIRYLARISFDERGLRWEVSWKEGNTRKWVVSPMAGALFGRPFCPCSLLDFSVLRMGDQPVLAVHWQRLSSFAFTNDSMERRVVLVKYWVGGGKLSASTQPLPQQKTALDFSHGLAVP